MDMNNECKIRVATSTIFPKWVVRLPMVGGGWWFKTWDEAKDFVWYKLRKGESLK